MTPRRRRLVRYSAGIAGLTFAIAGLVWGVEYFGRPADPTMGIDDILRRELPADTPRVSFVDATAEAGVSFRHFTGTRTHRLPEDMGSGLAWGDCDGDGDTDLYLVSFVAPLGTAAEEIAELPGNALYRNRGDGTFETVGDGSGADLRAFGMGATWGDYDGDGDLDLYITNYGVNVLLRNEGACRFVDVTAETGVAGSQDDFSAGATWGDYDGDGDLDLYVTNYVQYDERLAAAESTSMQFEVAVPFTLNPASFEPANNRLYRNDDGHFLDVAAEVGVANPRGRSLSAAWADLDEDGDLDLYVANDISDNALYSNRGDGGFDDISTESLTADYRGAMGLALTDFDRDGDLDFFVTHWVAQENGLYMNHLEMGSETIFFADVAEMMGLGYTALQYVGWGTAFVDYDNDSLKDLFVANGHTFEDKADSTRLVPQKMQLFWNRGDQDGFFDVTEVAGPPFGRLLVARGAAAADYDGNGTVDLAVLENGGAVVLLRNTGAPDNHWIEFDLRQPGGNRFGLGAQVRVSAGGTRQSEVVGSSPSYLSHNDLRLHFGLGSSAALERVEVRWPDGVIEEWLGTAADQVVTLQRGTGLER